MCFRDFDCCSPCRRRCCGGFDRRFGFDGGFDRGFGCRRRCGCGRGFRRFGPSFLPWLFLSDGWF